MTVSILSYHYCFSYHYCVHFILFHFNSFKFTSFHLFCLSVFLSFFLSFFLLSLSYFTLSRCRYDATTLFNSNASSLLYRLAISMYSIIVNLTLYIKIQKCITNPIAMQPSVIPYPTFQGLGMFVAVRDFALGIKWYHKKRTGRK